MVRHYKALIGMVAATIFVALPVIAATTPVPPYPAYPNAMPTAASAVPGTVNYVEGQAAVAGQTVTQRSIGTVQLEPGQILETGQGRAEVLLMPGVFLRVGDNSAVRLVSPDLLNTRVEVVRGQAIVEVDQVLTGNNLWVLMNGATTRLDKQGLYDFNAVANLIQVFDGKATVEQGDRHKDLDKGHELALTTWKADHFDIKAQAGQNPLYAWSNVRSEYVAEASMQSARTILVAGAPYWYGPGWYWNPYWDMYGFIPADGIWFSPFGWPFYSPWAVYWAPGFYGGFGFRGGFPHGFVGHGHIAGSELAARGGSAASGRAVGGFGGHGFAGGMHAGGFGGGGGRR